MSEVQAADILARVDMILTLVSISTGVVISLGLFKLYEVWREKP